MTTVQRVPCARAAANPSTRSLGSSLASGCPVPVPRVASVVSRAVFSETSAPATFEEKVTRGLRTTFDEEKIGRVLDSWEFAGKGGVYRNSSELGEQEASSFVAGLTAQPWHDPAWHPWLGKLAEHADEIAAELRAAEQVLAESNRRGWETAAAARDDAFDYGPDWRTLVLLDRSRWEPATCKLFPRTVELVRDVVRAPAVEVFFARQDPKTGIASHTDFTNFVLTSHVSIDVPEAGAWIKVGNEKRYWQPGQSFTMDTSFMHETENESDQARYVLIIRHWHHELTALERAATLFLFDCVDYDVIGEVDPIKAAKMAHKDRVKEEKRRQKQLAGGGKKKGKGGFGGFGKK